MIKMAICPKCKTEINYLKEYQSGEMLYEFDGEDYEVGEFQPDDEVNDYECPECAETLFRDEKKAKEFLKGD